MRATFINFEKRVTLNFDLNSQNHSLILYNWLYVYHEAIYWEIEMHETGKRGVKSNDNEITFTGDNGIFTLERVRIPQI